MKKIAYFFTILMSFLFISDLKSTEFPFKEKFEDTWPLKEGVNLEPVNYLEYSFAMKSGTVEGLMTDYFHPKTEDELSRLNGDATTRLRTLYTFFWNYTRSPEKDLQRQSIKDAMLEAAELGFGVFYSEYSGIRMMHINLEGETVQYPIADSLLIDNVSASPSINMVEGLTPKDIESPSTNMFKEGSLSFPNQPELSSANMVEDGAAKETESSSTGIFEENDENAFQRQQTMRYFLESE